MKKQSGGLFPFLSAVLLLVLPAPMFAQVTGTLQTIHSFSAYGGGANFYANADGGEPSGGVIVASDGDLYGTTGRGGANGTGTVFRLTPDGTLTTLHSFGPNTYSVPNDDGFAPEAGVIQGNDGSFYGTTSFGGPNHGGTVFRLTPDGTLTTLHSFGSGDDGSQPFASLVQGHDGRFYGTTRQGGHANSGVLFAIGADGSYDVLYTFTPSAGEPEAALVQGADGRLYGTTSDNYTVFAVTPTGEYTSLHAFGFFGEEKSRSSLVQGADGNLYGAASVGNYVVSTNGTVSILPGGGSPLDNLVPGQDGALYGTSYSGGDDQHGAIYRLITNGTTQMLYGFSRGTMATTGDPDRVINGDGDFPLGTLVQAGNGSFYGTAEFGGSSGNGTVFRLDVTGTVPLPSVSFKIAGNGSNKNASIVAGGAPVEIKVSRTDGDLTQPLTVAYQVKTKAVAGQDYDALSGSVTIPAGSSKAKFTVQALAGSTALGVPIKLQLAPRVQRILLARNGAEGQAADQRGDGRVSGADSGPEQAGKLFRVIFRGLARPHEDPRTRNPARLLRHAACTV